MGASIRLGKILGIPIGINYSWIVVFLLIVYLLYNGFNQTDFGQTNPTWELLLRVAVSVVTAVFFFLSVLAHELSHSLMAISKGIPVRGITLFIFGGVSQLGHEARHPFTEFLVAIVGPLTSIVIGILCLGIGSVLLDFQNPLSPRALQSPLSAVVLVLASVNLSVGVFNMAPGFPLDGGRVLRAVVWGVTGSYWKATQVAARAGQGLALLMVLAGLAMAYFGSFQSIWLSLVGAFLFTAATASYRHEKAREQLKFYRVSDAMTSRWTTLSGNIPLASPIVSQMLAMSDDFLVVLSNGDEGILTRRGMNRVPQKEWPYTPAADAMTPLAGLPQLGPEEGVFDALERMDAEGVERMTVVRNGSLLGFVRRSDMLRLVQGR